MLQTSVFYQEAFGLFINGNLEQALVVLDDTKLQAKKIEWQHEQKKLADTFLLKAELLQLKFDFESAARQFDEAIEINPDANTYFAAAKFHQFLNHFQQAEQLYCKALSLASSNDERAKTLNNLSVLQDLQNDYSGASSGYRESLGIYRDLTKSNPQTYLPDVATTLINLGWLLRYFTLITERLDTRFALLGDRCIEVLFGIRSCYGTEMQFTPEKKSSQSNNQANHGSDKKILFIQKSCKSFRIHNPTFKII